MADVTIPDIRLSPDGSDVAIRNVTGHPVLKWRTTSGLWLTDDEAAGWMPLVPASHRTHANNSGDVNGTLLQINTVRGQVRRG